MAAENEVSLLFRLKAESSQVKSATDSARASVAQLRQSFGTELTAMQGISKKAFEGISEHVNVFARQRVPIAGGAVVNLTSSLRGLADGSGKSGKAVEAVGKQIAGISKESGKSTQEIAGFLTKFVQLETQAKRDTSAIQFFGAQLGAKLIPQLEATGESMSAAAAQSEGLLASLGTSAGVIGIAVVALIALAAAEVLVAAKLFELVKGAAEFEGKMFDLAQQTGVTVETLSALEIVAATTGGNIGSMTASLGIFQRKLEEADDPLSKTAQKLRQLGVDGADTETALRQTLKALSEMPVSAKQTALALDLFGRGGKQLLAVLKETNGDLDATIDRFRKLGVLIDTDTAQAADEFNDTLALIHFQIRAVTGELAEQAMPLVLQILRDLSFTLSNTRELFVALGYVIGAFAQLLTKSLHEALVVTNALVIIARTEWQNLKIVLEAVAAAYRAVRDAAKEVIPATIPGTNIPTGALTTPAPSATPSPEAPTKEDASIQKSLRSQVLLQQEITTAVKADAEQRRQIANQNIATAELEFTRGNRTRRQQLQATLDGNREKLNADLQELALEKAKAATLLALNKDDVAKRQEHTQKITEIDAQARAKIAANDQNDQQKQAELDKQEQADELAHRQRLLDIAADKDRASIDLIKNRVTLGQIAARQGEDEIEAIETAGFDRRYSLLLKALNQAGVEPSKKREINDQLKALDQDRTRTEQEQAARRAEISRQETRLAVENLQTFLDATLRIGEIRDSQVIASLRALAELRVRTEEDTEKAVLAIQLRGLDRQKEALEAQLTAAKTITDPAQRSKEETKLNNDLRVLQAQREAIENEGFRNVQAGRDKDLSNLRDYQDRVLEIEEEITDEKVRLLELEIDNLALNHGKRLAILRAEQTASLARLDAEKARVLGQQKLEENGNADAIKLIEKLIATRRRLAAIQQGAEKKNTEESIENLERELEKKLALEKLYAQRRLLTEEEFQRRKKAIDDRFRREAEGIDEFGFSLQNMADSIERSIVPLSDILSGAFFQIADAIGQTVKTWVLLGETGPAVMRKMLAEALASIAAEAAVNAVKELALGFAMLFLNPAEAAGHFTSAALWASIGGVAAIAGRSVAGDLFKQKSNASSATPQRGGGSTTGSDNPAQVINMERNKITVDVHIHTEPGFIAKSVVRAIDNNNPQLSQALKKATS